MIDHLIIAQQRINVIEENPTLWSENGMGRCSTVAGIIRIKKSMPEDIKQATLLHEVIHLIADMNGLKISETTVSVVSTGLMEVLRSNPEFTNGILGKYN